MKEKEKSIHEGWVELAHGKWVERATKPEGGKIGPLGKKHTYRDHRDICANCGKSGGQHFTTDGVSWCYCNTDRRQSSREGSPHLYTTFSYEYNPLIEKPDMKESNPNVAFKNAALKASKELEKKTYKELGNTKDKIASKYKMASDYKTFVESLKLKDSKYKIASDYKTFVGLLKQCSPDIHANEFTSDIYIDDNIVDTEDTTGQKTVTVDVNKVALSDFLPEEFHKSYGGVTVGLAEKMKLPKEINEDRDFLEEPKKEGGRKDDNEQQ